jgi:hypothetical protein
MLFEHNKWNCKLKISSNLDRPSISLEPTAANKNWRLSIASFFFQLGFLAIWVEAILAQWPFYAGLLFTASIVSSFWQDWYKQNGRHAKAAIDYAYSFLQMEVRLAELIRQVEEETKNREALHLAILNQKALNASMEYNSRLTPEQEDFIKKTNTVMQRLQQAHEESAIKMDKLKNLQYLMAQKIADIKNEDLLLKSSESDREFHRLEFLSTEELKDQHPLTLKAEIEAMVFDAGKLIVQNKKRETS